jgi:hypothetical protein
MGQVSLEVGARAGFSLNGASVAGNSVDIQDENASRLMLLSGSLNGLVELGFFNKVFIQPEIGLTQKGWRFGEDETLLGENFYAERLTYRDMPILLKIAVKSNEDQLITVYAGPSFNRLLKARTEEAGEKIEHDLESGDIYDTTELGLVIGLSAKGNITGKGRIIMDVRLTSGGTPYKVVTENGQEFPFTNWALNFSLGFALPTL